MQKKNNKDFLALTSRTNDKLHASFMIFCVALWVPRQSSLVELGGIPVENAAEVISIAARH